MNKMTKVVLIMFFILSTIGTVTTVLIRRDTLDVSSESSFPFFSLNFDTYNDGDETPVFALHCDEQVIIDLYGTIEIDVLDKDSICQFEHPKGSVLTSDEIEITMEPELDSTTIGNQFITVSFEFDGVLYEDIVRITVLDREAPTLEVLPSFQYDGVREVDYNSFVTAVSDNMTDEVLITFDDSHIDFLKIGTYQLVVIATDGSGNETRKNVVFNVQRPFIGTFEIESLDVFPGGVNFELNPPKMISNITYSIGYYNYRDYSNDLQYKEEYQQVVYDGLPITVSGFEPGDQPVLVLSYTLDWDNEARIITKELPFEMIVDSIYNTTIEAYTTEADVSFELNHEYQDNLESVVLRDMETDIIVQTWDEVYDSWNETIYDINPDTEYQIEFVFDSGSVDPISFQTKPQVDGDIVMLRVHYYDADGDYTNSGIGIDPSSGDYMSIPMDGLDEFGAYVELELSLNDMLQEDGFFPIDFFDDVATESRYGSGDTIGFNVRNIHQRVYLDADLYFFEGNDQLIVKGSNEQLLFTYIAFPEMMGMTESAWIYDYYVSSSEPFDESFSFPIPSLVDVPRLIEVEYDVNGVKIPYRIAAVVIPEGQTKQYIRVQRIGGLSTMFFDELFTEGDIEQTYYVFDLIFNELTEDDFFSFMENDAPFYAVTKIEQISLIGNSIYFSFQEPVALNDVMTWDMYVEDVYGNEHSIYSYNEEIIGSDTFLMMFNEFDFNGLDYYAIGTFNDFDLEQAVYIEPYAYIPLLMEPGSGSLRILFDPDGDGLLDPEDVIWDSDFEYELAEGETLYYTLDYQNFFDLIPLEDQFFRFIFDGTYETYTFKLVYFVGNESRVYEYYYGF